MRGKRQGECLIHSYLDRLACEEGCRFSKQGFDFERVQTRSYTVLRNHVALAMVSWAMLTEEQHQAEELIARGKRQKDKQRHRPKFPFYSILKGWQRLFGEATILLNDRLRPGKPPGPLIQLALSGLTPRLG